MSNQEITIYKSFDTMSLNDSLLKGIYTYGFEEPSNIQKKSIIPIINKRDIIAQAQSGTGKTASFIIGTTQLLININKPEIINQALILAPTRELAIQINNVTSELIKFTSFKNNIFIGGTSSSRNITNQVSIGTPGRIYDLMNRNILPSENIKLLVLDEADEMLSRGFKEQINIILGMISKTAQIVLFSATMPIDILQLTEKFMNNPLKILVPKDDLTLEGIRQYYVAMEKEEHKIDTLCDIYKVIKITQCIIYTNSKKKTEVISKILNEEGFPVNFMHGGLIQDERKRIMEDFRSGRIKILITTDILSRGIDIQQVSLVINYDLPKEKETYIHRIGRSGRFGRKGTVINFISVYDITSLKVIEQFYNTTILTLPENVESVIIT
jgi:superfamily II DNA/RNA helicase